MGELEKDKAIDHPTYHCLWPGDAIHCLYELPKIHKEGDLLLAATYNISKNTAHHIKNSTDFTNTVQKLFSDPDETIVSFDVVSLSLAYLQLRQWRWSENNYSKKAPKKQNQLCPDQGQQLATGTDTWMTCVKCPNYDLIYVTCSTK